MDNEFIKEMATDINNVASAAFQSGKEHTERPLLAKIERLQQHIEAIKKQFNESAMHFCESKPPEVYNGYNTCLSCKLRKICELLYTS